ncbi:FH2 domain-containing protein 1, partial [Branchiostoma belcheri]
NHTGIATDLSPNHLCRVEPSQLAAKREPAAGKQSPLWRGKFHEQRHTLSQYTGLGERGGRADVYANAARFLPSSRYRRDEYADPDLEVQLRVFEEQRDSDEDQLITPEGVNLNSTADVFYAIHRQVS